MAPAPTGLVDYRFHWWARYLKNGNPFHTDSFDQPNIAVPVSDASIPLNFNVDNSNANVAVYHQDAAGYHFRLSIKSNSTGEMWFTFNTDKPLNYTYSAIGSPYQTVTGALWRGNGRPETTYTEWTPFSFSGWLLHQKLRVTKVYDDVLAYRPYSAGPACPGCELQYYMLFRRKPSDANNFLGSRGTLPPGTYTIRLDWKPFLLKEQAEMTLDLTPA